MNSNRIHPARKVGLVPAVFFGAPLALVGMGLLVHVMPVAPAILIALVGSTLLARVALKAL